MTTASLWSAGTTDIPSQSTNSSFLKQQFIATASQTLFTLTDFTYVQGTNSLLVFKNGLMLVQGVDFTETSTSSFTLAVGASVSDKVTAYGLVEITGTVVTPGAGTVDTASLGPSLLVPIDKGGTGATTAAAALAALGGTSVSGNNDWTGTQTFLDNKFQLKDNVDTTKIVDFQLSGLTTGTTRTLSIPDKSGTVAMTSDIPTTNATYIRQTVLSGTVDSNGQSSFGGSTGSTTVTASTTIVASAANGFISSGVFDRVGQKTNPSWTGLSTNGTMYLGVTVNSDGTLTEFSTTLAPTYQWGGTYSTTLNQYTYNIQEGVMKRGDGSAATQVTAVFVGEVTVSGGVVTVITWYACQGRYVGPWVATLPGTSTKIFQSHNLGTSTSRAAIQFLCTTADNGYSVGDVLENVSTSENGGPYSAPLSVRSTRLIATTTSGNRTAWLVIPEAGGSFGTMTAASWSYRFVVTRNW